MSKIDDYHLRVSALSKRIVLARFGKKDENTALETKDFMSEVLQVIAQYMFDGKMPPKGSEAELDFGAGDEQFLLKIVRKKDGWEKDFEND